MSGLSPTPEVVRVPSEELWNTIHVLLVGQRYPRRTESYWPKTNFPGPFARDPMQLFIRLHLNFLCITTF